MTYYKENGEKDSEAIYENGKIKSQKSFGTPPDGKPSPEFVSLEKQPQYPGVMKDLYKYVGTNFVYPWKSVSFMEIIQKSNHLDALKISFMKLLLFFLLFSLTFETSAQVRFTKKLDPFIRKEYKKIRNLGCDTIIIYEQYCVGCEIVHLLEPGEEFDKPCAYEGFIRGKIYWKLNNRYFLKEIACFTGANIEVLEMTGDIFDFFFSNWNHFKSIERYKYNGKFFPPIPDRTTFEKLSIYTPRISHQLVLAEQQKNIADWKTNEWILPTIEIMKIVGRTIH